MDDLRTVLTDLVDALGHELSAPVVPAPPYVVVTSTGVVLRATLPAGRLVIALEPFTIERDASATDAPTYRRRTDLATEVCVR
ncbi:hypothetical protein [Halovivax cerinus]|uniref:DUF7988 domain-containing protein n=1 Tax=Halovivax cerinus TaxID=1487865 RepID=A0ABD5NME1_9EURY|nr:hypothetical protein [Halovivax cerinus]